MVAKKGDEREHHFAHESNKIACVVNHETVLHQFAKRVIQESGGLLVPFVKYHDASHPLNLNGLKPSWLILDNIDLEKPLGGVIPDLIGYSANTPVIIEVAYSSFVGYEKQGKLNDLGIWTLEIDLREFHQENFNPRDVQEAIINDVEIKKWLVSHEILIDKIESYAEEIITIDGIWVSLRELPFGDLAIKVVAYNPKVNAIVKAIAKRYYGRWRQDYKNWIVDKRWLQHAKNDLKAAANSSC
ncbi:hypothetical protein [Methylomonas methanica]|uniref:Uncharacterized protein n=1 Tax=Methylomonas methanica TaxID=421 RepID=A0A177LYQ1_METMH|nr:hypothetical protein A1332_20175 [Methylomonas methanica]